MTKGPYSSEDIAAEVGAAEASQLLKAALLSSDSHPISLDWLVPLLHYKHISSLTTHLKRHFQKEIDYRKVGNGSRTFVIQISIRCFMNICRYARPAARKAAVKPWMLLIAKILPELEYNTPSTNTSTVSNDSDTVTSPHSNTPPPPLHPTETQVSTRSTSTPITPTTAAEMINYLDNHMNNAINALDQQLASLKRGSKRTCSDPALDGSESEYEPDGTARRTRLQPPSSLPLPITILQLKEPISNLPSHPSVQSLYTDKIPPQIILPPPNFTHALHYPSQPNTMFTQLPYQHTYPHFHPSYAHPHMHQYLNQYQYQPQYQHLQHQQAQQQSPIYKNDAPNMVNAKRKRVSPSSDERSSSNPVQLERYKIVNKNLNILNQLALGLQ